MQRLEKFIKRTNFSNLFITFMVVGLCLFICNAPVCAQTNTASKTINVSLTNATLKDLFSAIEKASSFRFFYDAADINVNTPVTANYTQTSIDRILREKLSDFSCEIKGSQIIVKSKTESASSGSTVTVTGTVTDEKGEPVIGANILGEGANRGVITDANGNFNLNVPQGTTLVISYIGYRSREIVVKAQQEYLSIILTEDSLLLNEVVVVGYGTQKKGALAGSLATVKTEGLTIAPVSQTINALAGQLPGLLSSQVSGEPGLDYASINIRGFGVPVVIVDGVESSLNNVSPNEIADITILRDASAAVYGSRAGNGVILVTTKRGAIGKPTISFDATFSWQQPTIYPRLLNAAEFTRFEYEQDVRGGKDPGMYRWPLSEVEKWEAAATPDYQSTDWWDYLMKDFAPFQRHNLSATGGNEKIKYFMNYNRADQQGMLKSDAYRYTVNNIRSNVDAQITEALTVSGDFSAMLSSTNTPPREHSMIWEDITGILPTWHAILPDPDKIPYTGNVTSVVASTSSKGGYMKKNLFQFAAQISAEYKIPGMEGLVAKGMFDYHRNTYENKYWMIGYDMWQYNWANESYIREGSAWQTRLNEGIQTEISMTGNFGLYYDKKIKDHTVSAMLLSEIVQGESKNLSGGTDGFLGNSIDYLFAGTASSARITGYAWQGGRIAYVGRLNYNYKSKYILETIFREDGSPVFAPGKRWGFFPSVSVAWRVSEEPFVKRIFENLNNFKLRSGVSKTGWDGIGNFQYLTGYRIEGAGGVVGNQIVPGVVPSGISNPDITWETITLNNAGIDWGIWNDKLYGSIDLFYRYRDGILAYPYQTMPSTFGAELPQMNINSMSNRGYEIVIGHRNKAGDLKYDISANMSYTRARNEHIDEAVYDDPDMERIYKQSGQWADLVWGLKTDGLFTSQAEIDNYPARIDSRPEVGNTSVRPGDPKFIDQNDDGVIDWRDMVVIGRRATVQRSVPNDVGPYFDYSDIVIPTVLYGMTANIYYKNVSFSALFQGGTGFSTWIWQSSWLRKYKSWTEENNDPHALLPVQSSGPGPSVSVTSDYTLVNVIYLRLKAMNIGYTLPANWLPGIKLRAYLAGTNLLTFSNLSKYKMDPESPDNGNYYPQQKVYTIGFNITF
ncbi:MAG: TonB-dependent receptor [Tannerella sp.]|jgi:TonB-linked SusC/RagA family outer membrane protein|nr:TonB-dependent receptor [Tannerella sp.]